MKISILISIFLVSVVHAQNGPVLKDLEPATLQHAVLAGELENRRLEEASGIASSVLNPDVLWVLNDGGNGAQVFAMDTRGKDLGGFVVDGAKNRDWEDMAAFDWDGRSWLLFADTGDNSEGRKECQLYFVIEPDIDKDDHRYFMPLYSEMHFTYEDGPRDCEAVAVDVQHQKILLLSKRNVPPVLYELPLDVAPRTSRHTAKRITAVKTIPLPTMEDIRNDPRFGPFGSQPTAMDITRDGKQVLVLTYQNAFIYDFDQDWTETFGHLPKHVPIPKLNQAESICFGPTGKTIYLTTEQRPAPLYFIHP